MKTTSKLRALLSKPGVIQAGGVADAGQARIVESVGYLAAYMSGAYVNFTHGVPDGTLGLAEITTRAREIASRVQIPLIADADDGFGDIPSLIRTVQEFERAGVAGLHMEDMSSKKHGPPMTKAEMSDRIKAATDRRIDADFVIIARTDVMSPWQIRDSAQREAAEQDAFDRANAYIEAGADLVMPLYATVDWLRKFGTRVGKPLLMLSPDMTTTELEPYNVKIVISSTNILNKTFPIVKRFYQQWLDDKKAPLTEEDLKNRRDAHINNGLLEREEILKRYYE